MLSLLQVSLNVLKHSFCSPCMLRDPHNKPLPTGLFIPASQEQIPYDDSVLYRYFSQLETTHVREMLDEVNETLEMVWQCESGNNPDPPDYMAAYNAMIYGKYFSKLL